MDIKAHIQYGPEQMPKAANGIEEQYQEIIQQLYKKTAEAISENDSSMSDMIDYYTLWAHQIKTPIAAMRLLLQSENSCQSKDELTMELFKIEQYVEMVLQYLRLGSDSTDLSSENSLWTILSERQSKSIPPPLLRKKSLWNIDRRMPWSSPTRSGSASSSNRFSLTLSNILIRGKSPSIWMRICQYSGH